MASGPVYPAAPGGRGHSSCARGSMGGGDGGDGGKAPSVHMKRMLCCQEIGAAWMGSTLL